VLLLRGRAAAPLTLAAPVLAAWVGVFAFSPPARATGPPDDPFSAVREEQIVTGATSRPQPLSETPSTVTVITADEIRAHGYETLGDALRWARGLYVTYDRNYEYVGVRGLLRPGDYNNKVLLTLDGHAVNGSAFQDSPFGAELGIDMERVERIEVVRGPGSALYGTNAVLAVINVVTRAPSRQPGLAASASAGGFGEKRVFASLASAQPGRPAWAIAASWLGADGADLFYPEYDSPFTHAGWARDSDGERAASVHGTAEWAGWRLAAKFNDRLKRFPTGAFGTTFGDRRSRTYDGFDFVELSHTRLVAAALELHAAAHWDGVRYHGYYVYGPDSSTVVNYDRADGDVLGTELRANWSPGPRDAVSAGIEAEDHLRVRFDNYDLDPYFQAIAKTIRRQVLAFFLQDEHRLGRGATLTGGARVDHYTGFGAVVSPRLDLVVRLGRDWQGKLLAGSAFRAPSLYETDYHVEGGLPQPPLDPERVGTLEAAVVRSRGGVTTTLSAYVNRVSHLIDLVAVDSLGYGQFANRARVLGRGLEGEIELSPRPGVHGRLSASWQESEDRDTHEELTNSPRWNLQLVLTCAPPASRWMAGLGARYLSPRLTLARRRTAAAVVADGRLARRLGRDFELGVACRNLFDARYGDPGSREHLEDQIAQDPRTAFVILTLRAPGGR
jgi:iron complex outermembrane receptor protein